MPMLVPHFGLDLALTCPVIVDEMQGLMHFWKAHHPTLLVFYYCMNHDSKSIPSFF